MDSGILTPLESRRYNRHIMLSEIGETGQEKLKKSKVLVVGAGGLGCPLMQYLAAVGIGKLGIVDNDVVDEGNLQRQVLYGLQDIGKLKAIIAKTRLQQLNPLVEYEIFNIRLNKENALKIVEGYDIIVDATDNYPTRYLINDSCIILNKPMVYGGIYKFEGQVSVFNYKGGPTYRCLYPEIPDRLEAPEATEVGVIGVLPGIIGSFQASEVIKMIIEAGVILSGRLFIIDIFNSSTYSVSIKKNPGNSSITELGEY